MQIKFTVCSDYHLHPQYPIGRDGITKIVARAKADKVDALLHCGDFIIDIANNREALDEFLHNDAGIPAFGCYGNHELECTDSLETLNACYGIEKSYYFRDIKGFRFVVTDANYFVKDGVFRRYSGYSVGGPSWDYDHNLLGEAQLEWLETTLRESPYPCVILSHSTFEVDRGGSHDAAKVRAIMNAVNREFPGRILLCMNGHYHTDSLRIVDNIAYFNVNTAYMGAWSPKKHDKFPKELVEKHHSANNSAFFTEPLSATVTLSDDGELDIVGSKAEYIYGVTPEDIGIPVDGGYGRKVPYISDAHVSILKAN